MINIKYIFSSLLALTTLSATTSCSSDDNQSKTADDDSEVYVKISLNMNSSVSRAASNEPNGGEDGDGTEAGTAAENKVNNVTLFFYQADDATNINTAANPDIDATAYFSSGTQTGTTYTSEAVGVAMKVNVKYHVLAVVNAGNISNVATTLQGLKDYVYNNDVSDASTGFIMSSAKDASMTITQANNSVSSPATTNIYVDRLAARVDVIPNSTTYQDECYVYTPTVNTSDQIKVSEIKLVNKMKKGEYLLKRVATATSGTGLAYLGDETKDANNFSTNYVLDPYTTEKTTTYTDLSTYFDNFYTTTSFDGLSDKVKAPTTLTSNSYGNYYTLDYTMENTMDKDAQILGYTTCLLLKAVYVPATVYKADAGALVKDASYTAGTSFYSYNGKFYADAAAVSLASGKTITGTETNAQLATMGIGLYQKGTCYYLASIRHSNNLAATSGIMEFGIVRNNIYRVKIGTFEGIGTPTVPDVNTPDGKDENINITIYVRNWNFYLHDTIHF